MTLNDFVNQYNGKGVNVDQAFGNQCWDLVALYNELVIGIPASDHWGLPTGPDLSAYDVWLDFEDPLSQYFNKVTYSPGIVPQAGDVCIWNSTLPGSGGAGHIDVVLEANGAGFTGFDQNWPVGSASHKQVHNYLYVIGFLRPKGGSMDGQADADDIKRLVLRIQRRPATDEDVRVHTGTRLKDLIRILSDAQETLAAVARDENAVAYQQAHPDVAEAIKLEPGKVYTT